MVNVQLNSRNQAWIDRRRIQSFCYTQYGIRRKNRNNWKNQITQPHSDPHSHIPAHKANIKLTQLHSDPHNDQHHSQDPHMHPPPPNHNNPRTKFWIMPNPHIPQPMNIKPTPTMTHATTTKPPPHGPWLIGSGSSRDFFESDY